jgi:cytochrome c oxidase subunit 3
MNTGVLRTAPSGRDGDGPVIPISAARRRNRPQAIYGVGLWVFMGVAATLFSLFLTAYVMRMSGDDAVAIEMPQQLWLSTTLLVLGSVLLQSAASVASTATQPERARLLLAAGGACAIAFVGAQGWAWWALLGRQVAPAGNPAGSFFFMLTALHAMHVAGGLIGWLLAARATRSDVALAAASWRIGLCARYWHFLLLVWLALFASFTWITPDVARIICRTA